MLYRFRPRSLVHSSTSVNPTSRFRFACLIAMAALGLSACGDMPLSGRYEGTFTQTIQVRETAFGPQGASTVSETEISNTQDLPLLIAVGIESDAVLDGLACPSIPLFFRDETLALDRGFTCDADVEVETRNGDTTRREERTETIEFEDLDVTEVETNFVEISGSIRREFTTVIDGLRALTHEEDIEFTFEGARVAPATGAL